ncbi:hypothetical protein BN4901_1654 [Citrobacter europaeus]|uniref:Uncharacterized protein n=1 Tax=Citrobacter europaeus TaxID=1914243 RepID=A0ABY0JMH3_9ENTR|nr:hypothetical protein CIP106467_0776 [Citrobacter europaeus]SBW24312.1 hypothetical protein BN4901_1654 [Citrobacter europaeus]
MLFVPDAIIVVPDDPLPSKVAPPSMRYNVEPSVETSCVLVEEALTFEPAP